MNTRAYSKTHHIFRMLNFILEMARNKKKLFMALESKRMDRYSI